MWGNPGRGRLPRDRRRPIPTRVGEPHGYAHGQGLPRAYPHACGGTNRGNAIAERRWGLSPRVWGNHARVEGLPGADGPIPTRVGEPVKKLTGLSSFGAYPHACGGTTDCVSAHPSRWGLSPRVWGNPNASARLASPLGPIPTRVGEPWCGLKTFFWTGAYPHACGGTCMWSSVRRCMWGLSPRVWGNRRPRRRRCGVRGPIPTRVGEPEREGVCTWQ